MIKKSKQIIYSSLFIIFFICSSCKASPTAAPELKEDDLPKSENFPGASWDVVSSPEEVGLSAEKLKLVQTQLGTMKTSALMVIVNGKVGFQYGEVAKKYNTHSIRKSFLSAMYGKYVNNGTIKLNATMADLGIFDVSELSAEEKKATVLHCLLSTSGVYHPALYESESMKRLKPERHSKKAGEYWYYNNWDFNVLGTIFEQETHKKIFEAINEDIAIPIGMQDYKPGDGQYITGDESIHPAYPFRVTARDLARFGLLMLNNGKWGNKQVIDSAWVAETTRYHNDAALYSSSGYGYLWWVNNTSNRFPHYANVTLPEKTYSARGSGGHHVIVIPEYNMVIVHRVDTDISGNSVSNSQVGKLVKLILDARM